MKTVLALAALAAVVIAFQNANAVDGPPQSKLQLVEVEQQTPYLESFNSNAQGSATQSAIRRVGNTGGVVFSSQAYALYDNQNPDGSRGSFPLEVEEGASYGVRVQFVKGPDMGIAQLAIDGRPLGEPVDLYAPALQRAEPVTLGARALSEGKHILSVTVPGKNEASSNYRAGIDLVILDSQAAPQPTPTAAATAEVGAEVPATLALTVSPASFGAFQAGVAREYTAVSAANVVSTAADSALTVSEPGKLANGSRTLEQPLRVDIAPASWSEPVSNAPATVTFKQAIGANEPLRTGVYSRTLTFTLWTTSP